jgi:ribosomal protein S21
MRKRKNFRKRPKDDSKGLSVKVWNNNVEGALKVFKRKVKDSNLMLDLKKKAYYEKPSEIKRHKKNLAKLRTKYAIEKEKAKKNY